ncbi:UDP-diphosphatase [Candidatus Peregrinibacteria bacterium]|nr:MAG: UDP-diphosphatase [Candidatus Peregrinibacteria bacterium]
MTYIQALLLGMVQGLTEFLPVSSSGHLVLAEHFLGINIPSDILQSFDITLHAGTLLALLIYFHVRWKKLFQTLFGYFSNKTKQEDKQLLHMLVLGTLPVVIIGLSFKDVIEETLRTPVAVFIAMGVVAVVLFLAEKIPVIKKHKTVSLKQGMIIGLFQAIALIPGISRSGTTIAVAMFQGIKREVAAEFSFLLGTVAIAGATVYTALKVMMGTVGVLPVGIMLTGFMSSFVVSLICVHGLLQFLKKYSLRVFSMYLIILSLTGLFFL